MSANWSRPSSCLPVSLPPRAATVRPWRLSPYPHAHRLRRLPDSATTLRQVGSRIHLKGVGAKENIKFLRDFATSRLISLPIQRRSPRAATQIGQTTPFELLR